MMPNNLSLFANYGQFTCLSFGLCPEPSFFSIANFLIVGDKRISDHIGVMGMIGIIGNSAPG
jgi:hypothetical protein